MKNGSIKDVEKKLLSDNWYTLNKYTFKYQRPDGTWEKQEREAYDRGNGAAILLYNSKKRTVVLTRQFRMPTYVNGNEDGMMIEVCAGLLDGDNPADCVRKETEEETGYKISNVQKVFQTYMSPGSVTEIVYLFVGEYDESMKVSDGGGADDETENIEVLELDFNEAMKMVASGEIKDAKTIMLLQHAKLNSLV
ncbi:nudix-type nucleoside diphosphatase (YffH/AdpP family) [Maribacter spongiicola]|uniref:GDP-mannose pyrophosphatase n=1 Tax=Maribacter spongiicola TaxID=1206753 RepID=A0A4R7JRK6_9FLAO|nr:GDP-mannose pyrophosphatase NudK [Maribacter spongiicola]TDT40595.1 nudix-type nucleoside diphosphatase (YffH/AdpP family) [Maribacter spongiicola]